METREPEFEIGLNYTCGCRERWKVSHVPASEPVIIIADYKCQPRYCQPCAPYYQANNTAWCNQVGYEQPLSLQELAERASTKVKTRRTKQVPKP